MLLGLEATGLPHSRSNIWRVIDGEDRYRTIEWNKPVPGIPYLPPLPLKEPHELMAEVFQVATYPAWRKGSTISTHNRTCYAGFTLSMNRKFEGMWGWACSIPRIFGKERLHGPGVVQHVNTIGDDKLRHSQVSIPSEPIPCPLPQNGDHYGHQPEYNNCGLPYAGIVAEIEPSSANTVVGHVLPLM